jgi:hypothetical protein
MNKSEDVCGPVTFFFSKSLLAILHSTLMLASIYSRYKSVVAKLITLQYHNAQL